MLCAIEILVDWFSPISNNNKNYLKKEQKN